MNESILRVGLSDGEHIVTTAIDVRNRDVDLSHEEFTARYAEPAVAQMLLLLKEKRAVVAK
jgi:hypothetical protein